MKQQSLSQRAKRRGKRQEARKKKEKTTIYSNLPMVQSKVRLRRTVSRQSNSKRLQNIRITNCAQLGVERSETPTYRISCPTRCCILPQYTCLTWMQKTNEQNFTIFEFFRSFPDSHRSEEMSRILRSLYFSRFFSKPKRLEEQMSRILRSH